MIVHEESEPGSQHSLCDTLTPSEQNFRLQLLLDSSLDQFSQELLQQFSAVAHFLLKLKILKKRYERSIATIIIS